MTADAMAPTENKFIADPFISEAVSLTDNIDLNNDAGFIYGMNQADRLPADQASNSIPMPPNTATITTNHGGLFHDVRRTKQASAKVRSMRPSTALVKIGE